MDYHPLLDLAAVVLLSATAIGFTPAQSLFRSALLPVLCALTWHCVVWCPRYIERSAWATSVGGYTLAYLFHYLDVGVLLSWDFELQGPTTELKSRKGGKPAASPRSKPVDNTASRLQFGFSVLFSWRFLNTPHQPRNLPQLDEKLQQSRARFLAHTALTITVCYLVLDAMDCSADPAITATFYSLDKVAFFSRLREVSAEEAVMRFFAAVGLGAGMISVQRGVYCIVAFVCVAAGCGEPADWPPFNGPWSEICGLRRFWSGFWHQTNTHRLKVAAGFLMHDVLRLPRRGKVARYLRPWTVFLLSALFHVAIDASSGMVPSESGALRFFLIQPLGIVIEDTARPLYGALYGTATSTGSPTVRERCLGAVWVGLWMAWTAPAYLYPVLSKTSSGRAGVVPFSVIGYVTRRLFTA
ncbi:membrane bound O-acyl transferase family-domain-containing protein [Staphylotrichum tortipilum]|uniref:Membrane bound O-acyl transferase family-domain-containing protein n=1 Tax=Staphylotrichum tortipilum TaxID=2831512 RepID=A0AAN6MRX2_9PEZI|nr:membrane bound O-acyl transferase family-domain-containing protein [Staphylotrichum longicolle]